MVSTRVPHAFVKDLLEMLFEGPRCGHLGKFNCHAPAPLAWPGLAWPGLFKSQQYVCGVCAVSCVEIAFHVLSHGGGKVLQMHA